MAHRWRMLMFPTTFLEHCLLVHKGCPWPEANAVWGAMAWKSLGHFKPGLSGHSTPSWSLKCLKDCLPQQSIKENPLTTYPEIFLSLYFSSNVISAGLGVVELPTSKELYLPSSSKITGKVLFYFHPLSTSQMLMLGTFTNPHWKKLLTDGPMKLVLLSTWVTLSLSCTFKVDPEVSSHKTSSARVKWAHNMDWKFFFFLLIFCYWRKMKKVHKDKWTTSQCSFQLFAHWTAVEP